MLRQTIIVHNRNAWRTHRTQAAIDAQQGLQLCTMEQLAARLAGGFLQPIDDDALNLALAAALVTPLGDLDAIKALPGFQRAAAATLGQAWTAGLDLTAEMAAASTGTAAARLGSFATLEREVLKHLPANQLRPRNLVAAALEHVRHSRALFGRIAIRGHTEMSPVWRPLLSAMTQATDVAWIADARYVQSSQLQRPSPQPTLTWNRPEPLLSGHFSDTAPHLCPFFANLRCTRPRVSLPAPAAPRSSAASRRRAAGSDDLPPAGASSIWRASPAGLRFSPAAAGDSSATSA